MKIVGRIHGGWKVRDLIDGFAEDSSTGAVTSMNGRLNVRPPYQREFVWDQGKNAGDKVYGGQKQQALIDSVLKQYPINVMYFVKTGVNLDGKPMYEVLDGQQRIITMAKFADGAFGLRRKSDMLSIGDTNIFIGNLENNGDFYDFKEFTVYICEAEDEADKLRWFERINTIGEPLTTQEMRSAIANGKGTTRAKKYFVHSEGKGKDAFSFDPQSANQGKDYIGNNRRWDRQEVYEQIITWRLDNQGLDAGDPAEILRYMQDNKDDEQEADKLFDYFKNVVKWVKILFPNYHKDMKKVEWGFLYNKYGKNTTLAPDSLTRKIRILQQDIGDGDNEHLKKGSKIYEYVLAVSCGEDEKEARKKYLQVRDFTEKQKIAQYERQHHVCPHCKKRFENISWMDGDHIVPYSPLPDSGQENGKTVPENLQMLCHSCNAEKSNNPFDIEAEHKKLQEIYNMTNEQIAALKEGSASVK